MTLPVGTDGKRIYPAVKFKLTRSYKTNDGSVKADSVFGEKYNVLTSAKVKEIYENTQSDDITGYVSFDNVDIYAPNGNEYIYSVEEIKTGFLENFETWAVKGESEKADVEKEGK